MMTQNLQDMLGIELPIIQAPMAGVQKSALAVAVCNAGALGSLPCAMLDPEQIRSELTALTTATDKPYNINFFCHRPPPPDDPRETAWRVALAGYYDEFGLAPDDAAEAEDRAPFGAEALEILQHFKPPVVSFHFGLPADELLHGVRETGARIFCSATTLDEARWLEARGVDAVIAQGVEAGGHRGMFLTEDVTTQSGSLALLPQIIDAVDVPVIAAGGIASAAGVRAALDLGAAAVQVGTTFLLCDEATTAPLHRAALKSADAAHTALTNLFSGRPARGIVNRIMRELGPLSDDVAPFPRASAALAPLRSAAEARGLTDFTSLWCGQNASGCDEVPAAVMVQRLAANL